MAEYYVLVKNIKRYLSELVSKGQYMVNEKGMFWKSIYCILYIYIKHLWVNKCG